MGSFAVREGPKHNFLRTNNIQNEEIVENEHWVVEGGVERRRECTVVPIKKRGGQWFCEQPSVFVSIFIFAFHGDGR